MGNITPASKARIEPEILRPLFWAVADPYSFQGFATPFEKIVVEQGRSVADVAAAMHLDPADYAEMQAGKVRPGPEEIVAFCKATNCTPLDLYKAPANTNQALPREIFDSMVMMIANSDGSSKQWGGDKVPPAMAAIGGRLKVEYKDSINVIQKNLTALKPLLTAMGYSRDLSDSFTSDEAGVTPLSQMVGHEAGRRAFMDDCMNDYQSMLERDMIDHVNVHKSLSEKSTKAYKLMCSAAEALYGKENSLPAIARLMTAMKDHAEQLPELRKVMMKNPGVFGFPLDPDAPKSPDTKAGVLFATVKLYNDLKPAIEGKQAERLVIGAYERLAVFEAWRDKPQTEALMSWFENWAKLYQLTLSSVKMEGKPVPKGFPLSPV